MRIKILSLSGSPVSEGSTELLLQTVAESLVASLPDGYASEHRLVRLNDLTGIPCQSCGIAPTDEGQFCFFEDDISTVYDDLVTCDCLLFGSPLYFDSISAQAKLFMDRCNCFRTVDFGKTNPDHHFIKRIGRKRPGAMVFVGGAGGWYEGARRSVAGWFKWLEVVNEGMLIFHSQDDTRKGEAAENEQVLTEARELGLHLAKQLAGTYA